VNGNTWYDIVCILISRAVVILANLCSCGTSFSVDYVLSCSKRSLPSLRQNEICHSFDRSVPNWNCSLSIHSPDEFHLSTSNTQEGARTWFDIDMNGFWGSHSDRCSVDVHVFNPWPLAPFTSSSSLSSTFKKHENVKCQAYDQRIYDKVEHACFFYIYDHVSNWVAGSWSHNFL